jgi:hypothetical protein
VRRSFEDVQPLVALLLSLCTHPAFPLRALQGLPVLCSIVSEAAAANATDTLVPVLAATFRVCLQAGNRLVYPDLCSLSSSLLAILPSPLEVDPTQRLTPSLELLQCMVIAVTCVVVTLTRFSASGPAWLRLHTRVLLRLKQGLAPLPPEVLSASFDISEALGASDGTWIAAPEHTGLQLPCFESATSLLLLTAMLEKHFLEVHRKGVLQAVALCYPLSSNPKHVVAASTESAAQSCGEGDDISLVRAARDLVAGVIVPCLCDHAALMHGPDEDSLMNMHGAPIMNFELMLDLNWNSTIVLARQGCLRARPCHQRKYLHLMIQRINLQLS